MADFGAPVAQNVNVDPSKGLSTISSLLGLQQQRQALQGQAAQVQMEQQSAQQRQGLANYDWSSHIGKDGTLDLNSVMNDPQLRQAAGDQWQQVADAAIGMKQHQIEQKRSFVGLTNDQRSAFGSMVGGLRSDSDVTQDNDKGRQKVTDALMEYGNMYGKDALPVLSAYSPVVQHAPQGKLAQALGVIQLQAMDAGSQVGTQKPAYMSTGGQFQQINPQAPGSDQPPQSMQATVAPSVITTPAGPLARVGGNGSTLTPLETAQGQGGPGAPPPNLNPTTAQATVTNRSAAAVTDRVQQAQSAANNTVQAQDALTRARAILDKPGAPNTGNQFANTQSIRNFLSSVGIDTQGATDANSLVKNLARYEASRATQAGLGGTDAARELAHNGSPNVSVDNKALKGIVTQSLATEKALAAYANIQTKTKDPNALAKNESDFRNIPNLIQGYEYGLARTPEEANEFLKAHGLTAAEMKATRQRIKEFEGR